jgi:hypothetical protein
VICRLTLLLPRLRRVLLLQRKQDPRRFGGTGIRGLRQQPLDHALACRGCRLDDPLIGVSAFSKAKATKNVDVTAVEDTEAATAFL